MTSLRFHIRFPENKIKEPIIYQIGHEFRVVTNVRRADVREPQDGWTSNSPAKRKRSNEPSTASGPKAASSTRLN